MLPVEDMTPPASGTLVASVPLPLRLDAEEVEEVKMSSSSGFGDMLVGDAAVTHSDGDRQTMKLLRSTRDCSLSSSSACVEERKGGPATARACRACCSFLARKGNQTLTNN